VRIDIQVIEDSSDCETCGVNYSAGGIVKVDGRAVYRFEPVADCFGGDHMEVPDLLVIGLAKVGIEVYVDNESWLDDIKKEGIDA
jgi:hypothetical protein